MTKFDPSRRSLFSRFKADLVTNESKVTRPPNALEELLFLQKCTQCGDCVRVCPHNAIHLEQGYPVLEKGCDNCNECTLICQTGALLQINLIAKISYRCKPHLAYFCQSCIETCPESAIRVEQGNSAVVDEELCIGCGKCQQTCEFYAISLLDK